jgi:hypothetical protein
LALAMPVVRFRLGQAPDVGHVAGIPGVVPLELHGDRFTARVVDAASALDELRRAGFPGVRLDLDGPGING